MKKVGTRLNLYNKVVVDGYTVEERGKKAGRAAQSRAEVELGYVQK